MSRGRTYTKLEKNQILEEVAATGNVAVVAKKNNIPISTIRTWLHSKNKKNYKIEDNNCIVRELKTKLSDTQLENKILKDLLKKTYQVWKTE